MRKNFLSGWLKVGSAARAQGGGVLPEFMIAVPIKLMFVFTVADFASIMYQSALVTKELAARARVTSFYIAKQNNPGQTCTQMSALALEHLKDHGDVDADTDGQNVYDDVDHNLMDKSLESATLEATVFTVGTNPLATLEVKAHGLPKCFLCRFIQPGRTITFTEKAVIEGRHFQCQS